MIRWLLIAPSGRICTSLLVLVTYLAASFGVLPSQIQFARLINHIPLLAERFPCEDCSCGCASAEECWSHCCCHSEHERLVWALRNGVAPPSFVHFTPAQWSAAIRELQPFTDTSPLSIHRIQLDLAASKPLRESVCIAQSTSPKLASCCAAKRSPAPARPSCCQPAQDSAVTTAQSETDSHSAPSPFPSISPLNCKNLQQLLIAPPPTLAARASTRFPLTPVAFSFIRTDNTLICSRSLEIPAPPPRPIAFTG